MLEAPPIRFGGAFVLWYDWVVSILAFVLEMREVI